MCLNLPHVVSAMSETAENSSKNLKKVKKLIDILLRFFNFSIDEIVWCSW